MYRELANDEIRIEALEVYAYHGVYAEETKNGQTFVVNATLYTDVRKAGMTDELEFSTHYGEVCEFITEWMQKHTYKLLETVAEKMAKDILLKYPLISAIDLEIRKPDAPIALPFGCVSVKIHRAWHRAYVGIGSNMGDREKYISDAIAALKAHPLIFVKKVSDLIITAPYGGVEQEDFLNGALELETLLAPNELLDVLHDVENAADRKRILRWGPRTLDLDILFYDKLIFEDEVLCIPHPDLTNREFVLKPLHMLAPYYRHPVFGKTVAQMLQELNER